MTLPASPVIRPPGAGDHYPGPATQTIKLAARHTGGLLTVEEFTCPPGFTGPPAHVHHAHDETFVASPATCCSPSAAALAMRHPAP
jgi:hypothetical protein